MEANNVRDLMEAYASVYNQIDESQIGDRARKVVGDQRSGVYGDADAMKQDMDAINLNLLRLRPYGIKGFPSVKKDTKQTTQVAHYEPEGKLVDEMATTQTQFKPPSSAGTTGEIKAPPAPQLPKPGQTPPRVPVTKKKSLNQDVDLFDLIKGHLLDEGYADTEEAALAIMTSMSEEWRQSIVEQGQVRTVLAPRGGVAGAVQVRQTRTPGFLGTGIGSRTVSTPIPGTWTRNTPGRQASGPRSFDASGSGSSGARAEMGDRSGPTDTERSRFNDALTAKHTKGDKSVAPSPRAVNQRAAAQGHSGLMPTRGGNRDRTDTTTTRYEKPNQSWRGY
jgi:hypothetical protein